FFFQAEDGIRDFHVTGVQTCALPISDEEDETIMEKVKEVLQKGFDTILGEGAFKKIYDMTPSVFLLMRYFEQLAAGLAEELKNRSEERRVGKECRCGWRR